MECIGQKNCPVPTPFKEWVVMWSSQLNPFHTEQRSAELKRLLRFHLTDERKGRKSFDQAESYRTNLIGSRGTNFIGHRVSAKVDSPGCLRQ
jgi:hypothetical protein